MANQVDIIVSGTNRSRQVTREAADDTRKVGASAKEASKDVAKLGDSFDDVGDKADDARGKGQGFGLKLKEALGDQAKQGTDGLLGSLGQTGAVLGKLGPIGVGVGAAIGVAFIGAKKLIDAAKEAIGQALERSKEGARIGAQLGLDSPEDVKRLGKLAGKVYADNFGASLEEAATAVRDTIRNHLVPEDATDDFTKNVAEKLSVVAGLFEDNTGHVATAISTMLRTGIAKNSDEALDILTRGLQEGGDKAEDLLDTFTEYPTQLRKLGLSAQDSLGLMLQGLRGGARDSDIVADSLKEFSIRAIDGSKLTGDSFKMLGLNGKKMADDIAAGGDRAKGALDKTLDALRNVKDPVKQAAIATGLFGTQAEDLGQALFDLDPSTAVDSIGKVAGAADRASSAVGGGLGNAIETAKRKFEQWRADMGDRLLPIVEKVIGKLHDFADDLMPKVREALDFVKKKWDENADGIQKFLGFLHDMEPYVKAAVIVAIDVLAGSLGILIESVAKFGEAWQTAKGIVARVTPPILEFFGQLLEAAALAFGWIPGIGGKLESARKEFDKFRDKVNNALAGIADQQINLRVSLTGLQSIGPSVANVIGARVIASGLAHRASGGVATGLTVIDEAGREAVRLPTGATVIPHGQTETMLARAGGGSQVVVAFEGGDSDWLYSAVMEGLRRQKITVKTTQLRAA